MSKPWVMANEPIDLKYDTWFPTDFISANLRHVVSVIFSHPSEDTSVARGEGVPVSVQRQSLRDSSSNNDDTDQDNGVNQGMDVDPVSDGRSTFARRLAYAEVLETFDLKCLLSFQSPTPRK